MPLRKLWNSICGKVATVTTEASPSPSAEGSLLRPQNASARSPSTSPRTASRAARGSATREDKKLFRRIESLAVQSVLEIRVGDGSRSLAMLQKLTHKGHSTPVHYIAIDEFESGGGPLTLREFHKQLRELPAKAHLVPMSIDAGLDRVVRTYGQVDLIIWSADEAPSSAQKVALVRLSKPNTILFSQENGRWSETLTSLLSNRQAA